MQNTKETEKTVKTSEKSKSVSFKELDLETRQQKAAKDGAKKVIANLDKIAKTSKNILSKICMVATITTDKKFDWLEGEQSEEVNESSDKSASDSSDSDVSTDSPVNLRQLSKRTNETPENSANPD